MVPPSARALPFAASRAAVCLVVLAGSWAAPALAPLAAQAQTVQSPASGVLCDAQALRGSGVCYDSQGASIALTGRYLGRRAGAQLSNYLATNPSPPEFRLSNGTVCSIPARTCWEDGWSKRNVAQKLTRQLFSKGDGGFGGSGSSGDGWSSGPSGSTGKETGLCSLSRGSRPLFDGRCDLRQMNKGDGQARYRVRLNNGTTYVFSNRGGTVTIADDFGSTWPVTYVNHGVTGIFRWADMSLVATQTAGRSGSAPSSADSNEDLGRAIGTLLNTLFR